jgi:restriction system protein
MSKDQTRVFMVRGGANGEYEEYALEHGIALIGFQEVPALDAATDYDGILKLVNQAQPGLKPRAAGNYAGQLWAFAIAMKEGDIVAMPRKLTSQVALGRVAGPYQFLKIDDKKRHTRAVKWIRPDVPRSVFEQDLLNSFGAFMTVCAIKRNDAERRVAAVLEGKPDPGMPAASNEAATNPPEAGPVVTDLAQAAHDRIVAHILEHFKEHAMAKLVDAVLQADGWVTKVSPPGPDGGVDILAGRGYLGLDAPRLCVQVKSQNSPIDVNVLRALLGTMKTFDAGQGLLVGWGGFTKAAAQEAKQGYFAVRLWESRDLVEAIYRTYEQLQAEIQAELPLKKVWVLVEEESEE